MADLEFLSLQNLTDFMMDRVARDIAMRGNAAVVLPGGTTPGPLFNTMAQHRQAELIAWTKALVISTDERRLPIDDAQSNAGTMRRAWHGTSLLTASVLNLCDPIDREKVTAWQHPFATVVVGMGLDGHIASIYPGDASPAAVDHPFSGMTFDVPPAGNPKVARISLTFSALLKSDLVAILISGQEKVDALRQFRGDLTKPVGRLMAQGERVVCCALGVPSTS